MSERETGWYWCRTDTVWELAEYDGKLFYVDAEPLTGEFAFDEIGPRILPPDDPRSAESKLARLVKLGRKAKTPGRLVDYIITEHENNILHTVRELVEEAGKP